MKEKLMLDLLFVTLTIVFFLIALAYVRGCERLQ
jgi:succinate-acetate transporter protein